MKELQHLQSNNVIESVITKRNDLKINYILMFTVNYFNNILVNFCLWFSSEIKHSSVLTPQIATGYLYDNLLYISEILNFRACSVVKIKITQKSSALSSTFMALHENNGMCVSLLQKTSKSKSYFEAYKEYQQWEDFLAGIKEGLDPNSPLKDLFQTSEFWPQVWYVHFYFNWLRLICRNLYPRGNLPLRTSKK